MKKPKLMSKINSLTKCKRNRISLQFKAFSDKFIYKLDTMGLRLWAFSFTSNLQQQNPAINQGASSIYAFMVEIELDIQTIKSYWLMEADEALTVAKHLFDKEDYSYSLFFGHLALEKILKALYVDNNKEHAPPVHNLQRLAKLAKVVLDEDRKKDLLKITSFNIEARYPDIKRSFRKKCTKDFTQHQMEIIREIFQWLKKMMT